MESGASEFTRKISDVARLVGVEKHVLRYWEEELPLHISRDAYGSRCYTEEDVERFRLIASLRQKGCQLKAIREILFGQASQEETVAEKKEAQMEGEPEATGSEKQTAPMISWDTHEKSGQETRSDWEERVAQIVLQALAQYDGCTAMFWRRHLETRNEKLEDLLSQMLLQMEEMMAVREAREELRFRQLDESIRAMQRMRAETAATSSLGAKLAALFGKGKKRDTLEKDEYY